MKDVKKIITENAIKQKENNKPYNQITGEGCLGERVRLTVSDAPCFITSDNLDVDSCTFYLPQEMMKTYVCKQLKKYSSVQELFKANNQELNIESYLAFWTNFCELRINYDFEYFAVAYETIEHGVTAEDIPFSLQRGQRKLLEVLEDMRLSGTPIRVIILKARQLGLSTLVQLYMLWLQIVHKKSWHSVICAHLQDASKTIRAMFEKVIDNMPAIDGEKYSMNPFQGTQNIKEVPQRKCRITVGSAEKPESVRSQNPKLAHFSEVAFFPETEKKGASQLIGSIVGTIKREKNTMIVYESTANGIGDFFNLEWEKAKQGKSAYVPVFLPWYNVEYYSEPLGETYFNHSGQRVKGDIEDFINSMDEYELELFQYHAPCTLENIHWYRGKKSEMTSDELMKQEYPSDDTEAFLDSGLPAFKASHIKALEGDCRHPEAVGTLVANELPESAIFNKKKRKGVLQNIRFVEDKEMLAQSMSSDPKRREQALYNKLKIWDYPDTSVKVSDRYVVVYDVSKGESKKADWGVITVFDRYWMMYKGVPEIAAEWRGRIDKDIAMWIATQIATFYNKALLVVESNTYETASKEYDVEFIFDIIADYYDNLYSRTPADKINEGAPAVYGFHMNKGTKPTIMATYTAVLRDKKYKERNIDALKEAYVYEKKQNGSYGAKEGYHDDILDTRMIGNYICIELPLPKIIQEEKTARREKPVGESSF